MNRARGRSRFNRFTVNGPLASLWLAWLDEIDVPASTTLVPGGLLFFRFLLDVFGATETGIFLAVLRNTAQ